VRLLAAEPVDLPQGLFVKSLFHLGFRGRQIVRQRVARPLRRGQGFSLAPVREVGAGAC
jgi:hypothetical protein